MGTHDGTARSGGASPKPGHFLPGGAGDILTDGDLAAARPPTASRQQSLGLGKARAVTRVDPTLQRKARPLPADRDGFGAPPPAPLAGAPVTPLAGSRRTGGYRPVGWHSPSSRNGAQYSAEPPPIKPPARQYSKPVIAGLSVLALVMVTGATIAGFKIIDSYDNVDSPMARPSVKKSEAPLPVPADPTVTVTVQPVPDLVRLRQNKLYTAGKVPNVNCKEPDIKPSSQSAVLKYYQALLPCLNRAWEPVIKKSGYKFRAPGLVLQSKQGTTSCEKYIGDAFYCDSGEAISINWQSNVKAYKEDPLGERVWMMETVAALYGHHVQQMTEMMTAVLSREGWAKTEAQKQEWSRRRQLQASCLGAVFLGANKKSLGLTGAKLDEWEYTVQHSGDESDAKVRNQGSSENHWLWAKAAFKSTNPASCNTFSAPAKKVS